MEYTATYNTDIGIRKSTNQDSVAVRIIDTPDGQVAFAIVLNEGAFCLVHEAEVSER